MKPSERQPIPVIPLAVASAAVIGLEVFLTKLLAYTLPSMVVYIVLALAMLGFGASGSLVAVCPGWLTPRRLPRALAWSSLAFTASVIVTLAVFVRVSTHLSVANAAGGIGLASAMGAATLLVAPFLAGGLVVTLSLAGAGDRPGPAYAANLIGSGLGGLLPLLLLGPLGGERFVALVAALGWCAAWGYARKVYHEQDSPPTRLRAVTWGSLLLVLVTAAVAPEAFAASPEVSGQASIIARESQARGIAVERVYERWEPTGRVEVYQYEGVPGGAAPYPYLFYAQDGSAGSLLVRWDGATRADEGADGPRGEVASLCSDTLFGQGYFAPRRKVLVIGLGGGPDVQCALYHGAEDIDAVEINPASIDVVTGPFDPLLGGIGSDPRVRYHARDGRSFVHAARGAGYDLVQMSGVDTKHLLAAGSLALSENHLYTREAFVDYLESLAPGGVLAALRFGEWEILRATNTAVAALRSLGAAHPERHIVVLQNGVLFGLLIRREPFSAAELASLRRRVTFTDRPFRGASIFFYEIFKFPLQKRPAIVYAPGGRANKLFGDYFEHVAEGDEAAFIAAYPVNVTATDDDRPFFFDMSRYDRPGRWDMIHVRLLAQLLGALLGLSTLLILAPLWRLRGRGAASRPLLLGVVFFSAVGLAYLMIEVWLLHRFAMYLGHQTYSLGVVLAALLLSTGLGAWLGERLVPAPRRRVLVGVASILALVCVGSLWAPGLLEATWTAPVWVKSLLVVAFTAPLGLAMGLPFPGGLRWIAWRSPPGVPWCVGVNSFASVLAMVSVIPIALGFGYSAVLGCGVALYGVAGLASLLMTGAAEARRA